MKVSTTKKNEHYELLVCPVCDEQVYLNKQEVGGYECVCGRRIGIVYQKDDGSIGIGVNMSFSGPQALNCLMNALVIKDHED